MQSTKLTSEISTYYIWNDTTWPYSFCSWCSSSGKSVFLIFPWEFYSTSSFRCIILLKTCNDNLNTEWDHTHLKKKEQLFSSRSNSDFFMLFLKRTLLLRDSLSLHSFLRKTWNLNLHFFNIYRVTILHICLSTGMCIT